MENGRRTGVGSGGIDISDIITITDFQRNAKSWMRAVARNDRPLVITVGGRPAVVMLSPASFREITRGVQREGDELSVKARAKAASRRSR